MVCHHLETKMTSRIFLFVAFIMFASHAAFAQEAKGMPDQPEARVYTNAAGEKLPYLLLKPRNYDPAKQYPLVMFYHGAGERGDDNKSQWKNGVQVFMAAEN